MSALYYMNIYESWQDWLILMYVPFNIHEAVAQADKIQMRKKWTCGKMK